MIYLDAKRYSALSTFNSALAFSPPRGRLAEPDPGDVIDELRLSTELADARHDLAAMMRRVQHDLQQRLFERRYARLAVRETGTARGPRKDDRRRKRVIVERGDEIARFGIVRP